MHTSHGDEVIGNELSGYYLAGNITRTYDGMMIALPQSEWEIFQTMPQHKLVELLLQLAVNVNLSLPKQLMLSGHHEASEDLSIMANIGWQNWSEFGVVGPSLGVPDATSRRN